MALEDPPPPEDELRMRAYRGDVAGVQQLLDLRVPQTVGEWRVEDGASYVVEICNDIPLTPMMLAALRGHAEVLGLLASHAAGMEIERRDPVRGLTALCFAVLSGDIMTVQMALLHGADVTVETRSLGTLDNILREHSTLSVLGNSRAEIPADARNRIREIAHLLETAAAVRACGRYRDTERCARLLRNAVAARRPISALYLATIGVPQTPGPYIEPESGDIDTTSPLIPSMLAMANDDEELALRLLAAEVQRTRWLLRGVDSARLREAVLQQFERNVLQFSLNNENIATYAVRMLNAEILETYVAAGGAPFVPNSGDPRALIALAAEVFATLENHSRADERLVQMYREELNAITRVVERYNDEQARRALEQ